MFELEVHVAAVASGLHREVHPDGRTPFLEDKLIKIHLLPVRDIQQDTAIAYRLLFPRTVDIYRTARQMVRVLGTSAFLIHLRRPETTIDHDGTLL